MRKYFKDKELISAYVDGELSPQEKKYIEEKIKVSLELQKELEDLKHLKALTANSYDRISESPFFETRLMANLNAKTEQKFNLRKLIPAVSVVIITLGLMTLLKFNPTIIDDLINEQKSQFESFYKENLQPLLYAANLTNEDIFNFALYQELPLDSANQQILKFGYDVKGVEYFEIKNTSQVNGGDNLKKFVSALQLRPEEVRKIDSIISSYSDEISSMVLVNNKNSVAINPVIWNTRKVILADIISFAKKYSSNDYYNNLYPELDKADKIAISKWVDKVKASKDNQYIFCTPDSIFKDEYVFNMSEFKKSMTEANKELEELKNDQIVLKQYHFRIDTSNVRSINENDRNKQFEVFIDSNLIKVKVQNFAVNIPDIDLPDFDSIALVIQSATQNIRTVRTPDPLSVVNNEKYNFEYNTITPKSNKRRDIDLDALLKQKNKENDDQRIEQQKQFQKQNKKNDIKENPIDSLIIWQNHELKREMDKLRKELQKFRQEIKDSQSDGKDSVKQSDTEKPDIIEI